MRIFKFLFILLISFSMPSTLDAKEKKYKTGEIYKGDWKKGKPNGEGVMVYPNGDIYKGNWVDGIPMGEGTKIFGPSKEWAFIGSWKGERADGPGTVYSEKETYIGTANFYGERIHSVADFTPILGSYKTSDFTFNGKFDNGLPSQGEFIFSDGNRLEGIFQIDSSWPYFTYHQIKVIEGSGKANLVDPQYSKYSRQPVLFEGEWENGNFTGKITGTELTSEITSFIINVDTDGNQTGEFVYKNGDTYKGDIKNNKKEGSGVLTKKVGDNYQGIYITAEWLNDKLVSGGLWENIVDPETGKTKTYLFDVKNDKVYYTLKDGSIYELKAPVDGRQFYSEVQQYEQEQIKLAQEAARKEARKKDAKAIDQKYVGMVFEGEGSLLMLSGSGEAALIGLLIGARADQTLTVSFLPGGKVNVREQDTNVRKSDPSRVTTTQLLAMAVNSGGGSTYEATLDGNKIRLNEELYIVVSTDKKTLSIYGSDGGYKLKRKK